MSHIQHRCIIFINKHYYLFARFFVCRVDELCQSVVGIYLWLHDSPFLLFRFQNESEIPFQLFLVHVFASAHIKVEHRIFRPLLFHLFDGKSLEQVFLAFKVTLEGGKKQ